ncbi:hypothetical protein BDV06DRAFT_223919 [Aspergillus oleicola]
MKPTTDLVLRKALRAELLALFEASPHAPTQHQIQTLNPKYRLANYFNIVLGYSTHLSQTIKKLPQPPPIAQPPVAQPLLPQHSKDAPGHIPDTENIPLDPGHTPAKPVYLSERPLWAPLAPVPPRTFSRSMLDRRDIPSDPMLALRRRTETSRLMPDRKVTR